MRIWNASLRLDTSGGGEIVDLTAEIEARLCRWGVREGQGTVFVPGSTAGITTIEFEPGVVRDLRETLERLAPEGVPYHHDRAWGDGNGHAHVRAALIGPSLSFLIRDGRLVHGTWQQVVLCDFDNRPRTRTIELQAVGSADSPST